MQHNYVNMRNNLTCNLSMLYINIIMLHGDINKSYADVKEFFFLHVDIIPDRNHSLGERWYFVGSIVGTTLTTGVGPTSFCLQTQRNCLRLVRCWQTSFVQRAMETKCQPFPIIKCVWQMLGQHDLIAKPVLNFFENLILLTGVFIV